MTEDPIEQFEQQIQAARTDAVRVYFMQLRDFVTNTTIPANLDQIQVAFMFHFDDGNGVRLDFTIRPGDGRQILTDATQTEQ